MSTRSAPKNSKHQILFCQRGAFRVDTALRLRLSVLRPFDFTQGRTLSEVECVRSVLSEGRAAPQTGVAECVKKTFWDFLGSVRVFQPSSSVNSMLLA